MGFLSLGTVLPALGAPPPGGTIVTSIASARYIPDGLLQEETVTSNRVQATIASVEAIALTQDQNVIRPSGARVTLTHLLSNVGNIPSSYTLGWANNGAGCAADTLDLSDLLVVRDSNNNGVVDAGEPALALNTAGVVTLQPGDTASLLVQGTVPASSSGSACLALTATTALQGMVAINRDLFTIGNAAVLSLTKSANYNGVIVPGTSRIDFTVNGTNVGGSNAVPTTQALPGPVAITVNGATVPLVVISDLIPVGTQYIANTLVTATPGAVRIYRLPGDAPFNYRTTDDASAIEVGIGLPTELVRNGSVQMRFAVTVKADATADIRNTAASYYNDGSGPGSLLAASPSNTVLVPLSPARIGVAKAAGPLLANAASGGGPDGTGDVTFTVNVRNYGSNPLYAMQAQDVMEGTGATQFGSYTAAAVPATGQYTIVPGTLRLANGNGTVGGTVAAVNPGFNGTASAAGLLLPGAVLPVGAQVAVQFTVRVNTTGRTGNLFNSVRAQASTTPGGEPQVFDDSTDGTDPDPDGDGNPGNNSVQTPVSLLSPLLSLVKTSSLPRRISSLQFELDYSFKLTNTGTSIATNVRIIDNLNCTFQTDLPAGLVASWNLVGRPTVQNGLLTPAASFTGNAICDRPGQTNANASASLPYEVALSLVDGSRALLSGQSETVKITVRVTQKALNVGRAMLTNKAWAASFANNSVNLNPTMLVAAAASAAQSVLIDPIGTVYNSLTRQPIAGAVVTVSRTACSASAVTPITPAEILGAASGVYTFNANGTVSMTTVADGIYQFFLQAPPVNDLCSYSLAVTPPAGSGYVAPSVVIPAQAGTFGTCGAVVPNIFSPQKNDPTSYYLSLRAGVTPGTNTACEALHNHIPLDPGSLTGLVLKKEASKTTVEFGDFIDYALTLTNKTGFPITGANLTDALPPGFAYVKGSARLNGAAAADPAGGAGPSLLFSYPALPLPVDASVMVRYRVRVGVGSPTEGDATNRARAVSGEYSSNLAIHKVRVSGGVFSDEAYVFGKVYLDCKRDGKSSDGIQGGADEVGIPGVRLFLEDGTHVITDVEGKWSLYGLKPITHVVRLDQSTLPAGAKLGLLDSRNAGDAQSRFADLKKGEFHKANFIVTNCDNSAMVADVSARRALFAKRGDLDGTLVTQRLDAQSKPVATGDVRGLPASGTTGASGTMGSAVAAAAPLIKLPSATTAGGNTFVGAATTPTTPAASPASGVFAPVAALASGTVPESMAGSAASVMSGTGSPLPTSNMSLAPAAQPLLAQAAPTAVDLEAVLPTLDNQPGFIGLKTGDTMLMQTINVRVKGAAESTLRLTVNGLVLDERRVGKKATLPSQQLTAWEYIGVQLKPGANTLQLDVVDAMGNLRNAPAGPQLISIIAPDKLGVIRIDLPAVARADQRTPIPIKVALTDAAGVPVTARTQVTLETDRGRWLEEDLNPTEPGTQLFIEGGSAEFHLIPTSEAGDARVRVSAGSMIKEVRLPILPEMRPMIGVGIVEGVLDFTKRGGLALGAAPAGSAFERELTGITNNSDSSRASARSAFFFKGTVTGEYLLTTSYDTDKTTRDRLFRDIRPSEFYPVYGDSSAKGFDAQSVSKLYVRIDKNRSYLLYGDYTTASSAEVRQLSQTSRSLTGVKNVYEDESVRATTYVSSTDQTQQIEEFRAVGTSGPYYLSAANGDMVINSELIEVLVRDRNQPNVVLQRTAVARFVDYTVEPLTRRILFTRAISSIDSNLNPQSIRVTYEVESGGPKFTVAGTDVQFKVTDKVQLGVVASTDQNPANKRNLTAVTALGRVGDNTTVASELVKTETDVKGTGSAGRIEVRHQDEKLAAVGRVSRATAGFDNPGASVTAGRSEASARAEYKLGDSTTLRGEALYGKDATADAQKGFSASVQQKLSTTTVAEIGLRHGSAGTSSAGFNYGQQSSASSVQGANVGAASVTSLGSAAAASAGSQSLTTVTTVRGRVTTQVPGLAQAQVFAEAEQDINHSDRHVLAVGGNYAITDKTRAYGRYELLSTLNSAPGLNATAAHNTGIFGVESNYMEGGRVYNEYRIADAADSRSVAAAMGIRNTFAISKEVRLTAGVEQTQTLGSTSTSNNGNNGSTGKSTAVILGAEYLTERVKGSLVGEARNGSDANTYLMSAGVGYKLDTDWSLLARSIISNSAGQGASSGNDRLLMRQQVGLAYRPVGQDDWNALMRYEHKSERVRGQGTAAGAAVSATTFDTANMPGTYTTDIIAGNVNYNPARGQYITGRYAGKISRADDGFLASTYWANLLQGRYTMDIAKDWDIGVQAGMLWGKGGARQKTLGVEAGYQVAKNLWISTGYNVVGLTDRDLSSDYTSKGVYIRLRFKFDETNFGFAPVTAPAQVPAPLPAAAPALVPTEAVQPAVPAPAPVTPPALAAKTTIQAEALFDLGQANIKAHGRTALDDLAQKLEAFNYDVVITIGHTDSVGSDAYNQKLSEQRASAVRSYLVGKGVDAARIKSEGRASKQPVASNATAQGRAQNRRVEIEVTGRAKP